MRYEVRVYNLEETLPENRMTYSPCCDREEAKQKYANMLATYADKNHEVALCKVEYGPYGESVTTLASSWNDDPRRIVWEQETI